MTTVVKVAIVAGTVWLTNHLGIWDSSDTTVVIYEDIKDNVRPIIDDLKDRYCPEDNDPKKPWRESFVDAYNESVKHAFQATKEFPSYCERFADDVQDSIDQFVNPKDKDPFKK